MQDLRGGRSEHRSVNLAERWLGNLGRAEALAGFWHHLPVGLIVLNPPLGVFRYKWPFNNYNLDYSEYCKKYIHKDNK